MVFDGAATSSRVAFFPNNNIQDILLVGTQSEKGNEAFTARTSLGAVSSVVDTAQFVFNEDYKGLCDFSGRP